MLKLNPLPSQGTGLEARQRFAGLRRFYLKQAGCRSRRQRIRDMLPAGQAERNPLVFPAHHQIKLAARQSPVVHVFRAHLGGLFRSEADHPPRKPLGKIADARIICVKHGSGRRLQPPDELVLGLGDLFHRREKLQVDGGDVGDHAQVGLGQRAQLGQLALVRHGHL